MIRQGVGISFREWLSTQRPCPDGWTRANGMGMNLPEIYAKSVHPWDLVWLFDRMPDCKWASAAGREVIMAHANVIAPTPHMINPICVECCNGIRERVPFFLLPPFVGTFLTDRQVARVRTLLRRGEL